MGRWVSVDWSPIPVPYADFSDPQSLNLYGFVGGNPASKYDPNGHEDSDAKQVFMRVLSILSGGSNALLGAEKVMLGVPAAAAVPPTGGASIVPATYLLINGTGQAMSGGFQIAYGITGNKDMEKAAETTTAITTVSGILVLTKTGDESKAAMWGSVENLIPSTGAIIAECNVWRHGRKPYHEAAQGPCQGG
jgi:hypothetical protein